MVPSHPSGALTVVPAGISTCTGAALIEVSAVMVKAGKAPVWTSPPAGAFSNSPTLMVALSIPSGIVTVVAGVEPVTARFLLLSSTVTFDPVITLCIF